MSSRNKSWEKNITLLREGDFSKGNIVHPKLKKGNTIIIFYAEWCGHCQSTKPVLLEVADKLRFQKNINFAGIDCSQDTSLLQELTDTVQGLDVQGYPTIILFKDGKYESSYQGKRNGIELLSYALS